MLGLYNYNARWYDPYLNRFISADTIVPDPANPQSLNRYSYVFNNPVNMTDPSGHDPLGQEWIDEFIRVHGRAPDTRDEWIRLFSIAYPEEWVWSRFYHQDGSVIEEAIRSTAFQPPSTRSWDTFPDALERLSRAYTGEEEALFVRDVGFLFGGLAARSQDTGAKPYYLAGHFANNSPVYLQRGNAPPQLFTRPDGSTDGDANLHHWVAFFVLGYNQGAAAARSVNWLREQQPAQKAGSCGPGGIWGCVDQSDILIGNLGADMGAAFSRNNSSYQNLVASLRVMVGGEQ